MILQKLMKKPLLAIGILFLIILLLNLHKQGKLFNRDNLIPSSCKSVLVMLDKRVPSTWTSECNQNNLHVTIKIKQPNLVKEEDLRPYLYRELANNLIFIAKNSLNESLERVNFIHIKQIAPTIEINALTEGKFIAKFATLTDKKFIMEHLQATVQVKESIK